MPENDLLDLSAAHRRDIDLLEHAAREAGDLALSYFGKDPETWFKDNKSPVSEADMAVDRFLADRLRTERSAYGWLSEETVDNSERLDCARVFIVDPIDGTRAFLAGGEEWTVALAVVEAGRPIAAAVFCPVRDEMFLAVSGGGATLNGAAVKVSDQVQNAGARLSGPHSISANRDVLGHGFERTEPIRSLAYRIALVAAGRVDVAVARHGPSDWDLAAADLLVQEAGGRLTDMAGEVLTYNRVGTRHPALIAASEGLLDPAREAIAGVIGA